jgi:RNA polymerase sigma factor (sigma-70 family)
VDVRAEWIDFYDTNFLRVVRFVMHNGGARDEARDAAQDAFTESWDLMNRNPSGWQAVQRKETWIRTVALRRYLRPPGPRRRPLSRDGGEVPDRPAPGPGHDELTAQAQAVLQALRALDEEARTVMAFDLDGIPTSDIAAALHVTEQRVRDIKKRARTALKRHLAESVITEGRQP